MPAFEIRSILGLPTAGTARPSAGFLASMPILLGWLAFAFGIAAVVGLSFAAVWRTREGRGRAIVGVIILWIALFVVVTGIFIPLGYSHTGHPRDHHALRAATELRTAIMSYYSEYKVFPAVPGATKDSFGDDVLDTRNNLLVEMLLGESGPATAINRRRIQFFSARSAKGPISPGLWKDPVTGRCHLLDPWGNPYFLMIDTNSDNTLHPPARPSGVGNEEIYTNVAVWSCGKDGRPGGGDDVSAY